MDKLRQFEPNMECMYTAYIHNLSYDREFLIKSSYKNCRIYMSAGISTESVDLNIRYCTVWTDGTEEGHHGQWQWSSIVQAIHTYDVPLFLYH